RTRKGSSSLCLVDHNRRASPCLLQRRNIRVDERHCPYHNRIPNRHTSCDDAVGSNIDAVADRRRAALHFFRLTQGDAPFDGVRRLKLHASGYSAIIADDQASTEAIQYHVGADPCVLSNFHISQDEDTVVARCALAKAVLARVIPTVSNEIAPGHS